MSHKQSLKTTLMIAWFHYIQYPIQNFVDYLLYYLERRFYPKKPVVELTRDGKKWIEYVIYDRDMPCAWGNPYTTDWMSRRLLEDGTTSALVEESWKQLRGPKIVWPTTE